MLIEVRKRIALAPVIDPMICKVHKTRKIRGGIRMAICVPDLIGAKSERISEDVVVNIIPSFGFGKEPVEIDDDGKSEDEKSDLLAHIIYA